MKKISKILGTGLALGFLTAVLIVFSFTMTNHIGVDDEQMLSARSMSDDGTFTGYKFTHEAVLNDRNGATFNFYVKNNGITDVEISMNGAQKTTLVAGQDSFISETLGSLNKTYQCVARAVVDGEDVDIDWAVAVQD